MGFLFQGYTVSSVLMLLAFVAVMVMVNEFTRRSLKASIVVYGVLPLVLPVLVILGMAGSPAGRTWFGWVKVVSALIGVYGFMMIRFSKWGNTRFAAIFPVSILALNIAEAVYRELEVFATYTTQVVDAGGNTILGGPWNILNAIAGVICIITLTGFVGIRASKDKSRDMVWPDMTWMYIAAYTIWNFAYVYNCISSRSMYAGFGILLAAVIAELFFKRGVWLQHRAQILSFYAMFALSVDYQQVAAFGIAPTYTRSGLMTVSIASIVINIAFLAYVVYTIIKKRRNPLKAEIFTDSRYYQRSIQDNQLG